MNDREGEREHSLNVRFIPEMRDGVKIVTAGQRSVTHWPQGSVSFSKA